MTKTSFKKFFERARERSAYWTEVAILDFTAAIWRAMKDKDVSKAELARRLNSSPAYVSKVLGGQANFTIKSMVALAHALNMRVKIDIVSESSWISMHDKSFMSSIEPVTTITTKQKLNIVSRRDTPIEAANDSFVTQSKSAA